MAVNVDFIVECGALKHVPRTGWRSLLALYYKYSSNQAIFSLMNIKKNGHLIVVVGPSGSGKDSIIKGAQKHFDGNSRIEFVRRVITRECDPASEVHDSVSEALFEEQQKRGEFSVWWRANGLCYGLPVQVFDKIDQGHLLIANGSRAAIPEIRSKFESLVIVHIVVSEDVLMMRLANRNRESEDQIKKRLERNRTIKPLEGDDVVTIDNSEARESAIAEFITLVESY